MEKRTKAEQKKLDVQIEQLYYRHSQGKSIDVMDIGNVFNDCRDAHDRGEDIETAVKAAIEKYCSVAP